MCFLMYGSHVQDTQSDINRCKIYEINWPIRLNIRLDYQPLLREMSPHSPPEERILGEDTPDPSKRRKSSLLAYCSDCYVTRASSRDRMVFLWGKEFSRARSTLAPGRCSSNLLTWLPSIPGSHGMLLSRIFFQDFVPNLKVACKLRRSLV